MNTQKYSESLIHSAIQYGQALNRAAYLSAKGEIDADQRKGHDSRGLKEYKHRVLLQLEGIVQSAKTNTELISRLNSQVGRLTMQDIPADAEDFLKSVVNQELDLDESKNLITAFMRLSTFYSGKEPAASEGDAAEEDDDQNDALGQK